MRGLYAKARRFSSITAAAGHRGGPFTALNIAFKARGDGPELALLEVLSKTGVRMKLNAQTIGLKIQAARMAKGLTQSQLAKALKIDRGSVVRWETGKAVPKQVGIPRIAQVLGTTAEALLLGSTEVGMVYSSSRPSRRARPRRKTERPLLVKNSYVTPVRSAKKPSRDHKALEDIAASWDLAKPAARLIAALLITGDWSYKLKLINREIVLGDELLALVGREAM